MSSILSVRLDDEQKRRACEVLRSQGMTPSAAVQELFEFVIKHDALPFPPKNRPNKEQVAHQVGLLDSFHTKQSLEISAQKIREARLKERYGTGS